MAKSKITPDQLLRIAKLSGLPISESEHYIASQLSQAAEYVEVLEELDTSGVDPTYEVNHKFNSMRDDVVRPSLSQAEALSQAPSTYNGYFKTKATIKK